MPTRDGPKALLFWSSGKDSAYALSVMRERADAEVVALVTTIDARTRRVPIHRVREVLLNRQAAALGLPLWKVALPWPCPDDVYRSAMEDVALRAVQEGIARAVFGDLFLDDIRAYREDTFRSSGMELLFPLWGMPTAALAQRMLASGIEATITCVDRTRLDPRFVGAPFDAECLAQIPPGVDPCGENGEFHTMTRNGPGFTAPIPIRIDAIIEEDQFVYADMVPATAR